MFFYYEQQAPVVPEPTYSFSPEVLSFSSQGQTQTFVFTVTNGSMAENINITSSNPNFSVSPNTTGISFNDSLTVSVTFNGNDNSQNGTVSVTGANLGFIGSVSVNSSPYTANNGAIAPGDSGDPFAGAPAPAP